MILAGGVTVWAGDFAGSSARPILQRIKAAIDRNNNKNLVCPVIILRSFLILVFKLDLGPELVTINKTGVFTNIIGIFMGKLVLSETISSDDQQGNGY